jgi:hypothetical protein
MVPAITFPVRSQQVAKSLKGHRVETVQVDPPAAGPVKRRVPTDNRQVRHRPPIYFETKTLAAHFNIKQGSLIEMLFFDRMVELSERFLAERRAGRSAGLVAAYREIIGLEPGGVLPPALLAEMAEADDDSALASTPMRE